MRVLGNPIGQDLAVKFGAVPLGLIYELMTDRSVREAKRHLS